MVLPKQESNHFFHGAQGATSREMQILVKSWIRQYYSDVLGSAVHLLDRPNGLDLIEQKLKMIMSDKEMMQNASVEIAA